MQPPPADNIRGNVCGHAPVEIWADASVVPRLDNAAAGAFLRFSRTGRVSHRGFVNCASQGSCSYRGESITVEAALTYFLNNMRGRHLKRHTATVLLLPTDSQSLLKALERGP